MFPTVPQYKKWSLPSKWGFWAAVIGIPISIVTVPLSIWPLMLPDQAVAQRNELIFQTAHELRTNRIFLTEAAKAVRSDASSLPQGKVSVDHLLELLGKR